MKYLTCMLLLTMLAPGVRADFYDGESLLDACRTTVEGNDALMSVFCVNYIEAVNDLHNTLVDRGAMSRQWCVPDDSAITPGQLAETIVKYLETHRQDLNRGASSMVADAYMHAYQCE